MKRMLALILAALLLCGTASALAEDYCTIAELRQQTPVNLTRSYETKWGTLEINVPIVLPDVQKLPAIAYRCVPDYKIDFPPETTFSQCVEYNNILFQTHHFPSHPKVFDHHQMKTRPPAAALSPRQEAETL